MRFKTEFHMQTLSPTYTEISNIISTLDTSSISEERKTVLQPLADFINAKLAKNETINLNFICTHNSRRSHLSQIWAQAIAAHKGITNLFCYSGGTEATAMFPMIGKTLEKQGFKINTLSETENPVYAVQYAENTHPVICFSKTFDHEFNPTSGFAAIMTCSSADVGCPFVPGCEKRIAITFEDPKAFDNTPLQEEKYLERSVQIATEMLYVFSKVSL